MALGVERLEKSVKLIAIMMGLRSIFIFVAVIGDGHAFFCLC
jgi:hypothetical protein